jgi:uncharacterized membrane protein YhaH (DUF805 family)
MSDVTEDVWFFTHNGEQLGPVSLADLRLKAANRELDPRLDMVWCSGMAEWKPAGEIDGVFERRDAQAPPPPPVSAMAAAPNPYEASIDETSESVLAREADWPGVKRFGYIVGSIVLGVLSGLLPALLLPVIKPTLGEPNTGFAILGIQLLLSLFSIILAGKRFANLGMTAWWLLGMLVPFLNWWLGYRLFACPPGYAMHRKMDGIGIFLAILYWLFLVAMIALVALIIAAFAGAAGSPELQQQIKDAMQQAAARGAN